LNYIDDYLHCKDNYGDILFEEAKEPRARLIPLHPFPVIELFSGAGGLALGLEKAGLHCLLLNEIDKNACATLRQTRQNWQCGTG
jgi:DNA (cytosine-5)-methyltransferase 1